MLSFKYKRIKSIQKDKINIRYPKKKTKCGDDLIIGYRYGLNIVHVKFKSLRRTFNWLILYILVFKAIWTRGPCAKLLTWAKYSTATSSFNLDDLSIRKKPQNPFYSCCYTYKSGFPLHLYTVLGPGKPSSQF